MTRLGVGPWFVLLSAVYSAGVLWLRSTDPVFFAIPGIVPRWLQIGLGMLLLALCVPFFLWALAILNRGFPSGELFTGGPYAMCQHPVYGSWCVFGVPGIVLLIGTWIGLAVPLLMYVTLRVLVRSEERWLEQAFGDEYRAYRARTPAVFPRFW